MLLTGVNMHKHIVAGLAALLVIGMLASCQGGAQTDAQQNASAGELNVFNWISYMPPEVLDGFTAETGIKINYEEFDSSETMMAKISSGAKYDIAFPGIDFVPLMVEKGLLLEIDHSKVPNFKNIDATVISQTQEADAGNRYSLPYNIGSIGVIYWKDKVQDAGDSINLLSRPELKGKTVILDDTREIFGAALKSLGYSVNTTNEAEVQAAVDRILEWKANALGFDNEQIGTIFGNQDAWVAVGYPENILSEMEPEKAAKVGFFLPKEHSAKYLDCMVILKDSKNPEGAHKFIDYIYRPENLAKIFDMYGYPGISEAASPLRTKQPYYSAADIAENEFKKPLGDKIYLYTTAWEEKIKIGE